MATLTVKVNRLDSLLKYLRDRRGLARLSERTQIKAVHRKRDETVFIDRFLNAGAAPAMMTFELEDEPGSTIELFAVLPDRDNLLCFQLPATLAIEGNTVREVRQVIDPLTGIVQGTLSGPPILDLQLLLVDDWHALFRRLEREVDAERLAGTADAGDMALRDAAAATISDSYSRAFFNSLFGFSADNWTGVSVNAFVNANSGIASTRFQDGNASVDVALQKPSGGRFGNVRFDFAFATDSIPMRELPGVRRITRYRASAGSFVFTRPGFKDVNAARRSELDDFFRRVWIEELLEERLQLFASRDPGTINTFWQQAVAAYPARLQSSYEPVASVRFGELANTASVLTRLQTGQVIQRQVPAMRPVLRGGLVSYRHGQALQPA